MASATSSIKIKFILLLTCIVSQKIVESLDQPISGDEPLLQFSPDQAYKQKFLLADIWKHCHDAWFKTGGCLIDIYKLFHGAGGLPAAGGAAGLPLGPPTDAGAPTAAGAAAPTAADAFLDNDDTAAAAGGSGLFPDIGSWLPGLGGAGGIPGIGGAGGIPGIGAGIPGIGGGIPGIGGGLPGFGGPFSPACCVALAGVQKSCPGLTINPLYGPLVGKHCAAH